MGEPTYVDEIDIEVTDPDGLGYWFAHQRAPGWMKKEDAVEYNFLLEELRRLVNHGDGILLQDVDSWFGTLFNDRKVVGYWYPGTVYFLMDLAHFITGTIIMECNPAWTQLTFNGKRVYATEGEMVYSKRYPLAEFTAVPTEEYDFVDALQAASKAPTAKKKKVKP